MTKPANLDLYETLSSTEREVLRMVAERLTNEQIAMRLGVSSETVENHRNDLMQKLDLHTESDLIRFALRRGINLMED